jgi:focal adhesion kinase 1
MNPVIILHLFCCSEILMEERHQQQETMKRENRRVQAMSWGE